MATLRLFASAREAAGCGSDTFAEKSVGGLLDAAVGRYGTPFAEVLATCRVWLNGEEVDREAMLCDSDEVAVLPRFPVGSRVRISQLFRDLGF